MVEQENINEDNKNELNEENKNEEIPKPKKKYNYGDKYKGKYKNYNKEYHKKRYQEKKQEYKFNVQNRRKKVKIALDILKSQGITLNNL